jgi:hypothetical protein
MASFTVFFCGTGSNSYDFANTNYHNGELISTLARNHTGHEFVDWIIVDGPGSGNLQEAEKWVPAPWYSALRGVGQGKGWEENVAHAIAILIGKTNEGNGKYSRKEVGLLKKAGVGAHTVPGRFWGERTAYHKLHPRISPQELQLNKLKVLGQSKIFDTVNVIGWSRGAVTCHMFANAIAQTPELSGYKVNIFACDPVPGPGQFDRQRIQTTGKIGEYVAIYARDERSRGFTPVLADLPSSTRRLRMTIPGRHATLVGNASVDGDSGFNCLFGPGKVTRHLAESFLERWGTPLKDRLQLSEQTVLGLYDTMLGNGEKFTAMHDKAYVFFTQKGARPVGMGDGTWSDFSKETSLEEDPVFVNCHHRVLFYNRYASLYRHLLEGEGAPIGLEMHMYNLKSMYPNLYNRLTTL